MSKLTNRDKPVNHSGYTPPCGSGDTGPQKFVRLKDLRRDGYLPWGRSRIYDLIKSGVLPPPTRFGSRLTGYTLSQITQIQSKLMAPVRES